jgi:hypothetical protein
MARGLAAGSTVTVHAVRGMGGVVKTRLAVGYAYAHTGDYDLMWWIAAEEPASILDQFAALAARLGLDPVADQEACAVRSTMRCAAGRACCRCSGSGSSIRICSWTLAASPVLPIPVSARLV